MSGEWDPQTAEALFLDALALVGEAGLDDPDTGDRFRGELFAVSVQGLTDREQALVQRVRLQAAHISRTAWLMQAASIAVERKDLDLLRSAVQGLRLVAKQSFLDPEDGVQR